MNSTQSMKKKLREKIELQKRERRIQYLLKSSRPFMEHTKRIL